MKNAVIRLKKWRYPYNKAKAAKQRFYSKELAHGIWKLIHVIKAGKEENKQGDKTIIKI